MRMQLEDRELDKIVDASINIAPKNRVVALSIYGPYAGGYADEKAILDVLMIVDSNKTILSSRSKHLNFKKVYFLMVDKEAFERDISSEWLGGILAENMLTPYIPLINENYLWSQEIKAKKMIIDESLSNLILSFSEMSRNFMIAPEYFMFEAMTRRATLFPPLIYRFLNITTDDLRERNYAIMMRGFKAAIKEFIKEGKLRSQGNFLSITEDHIMAVRKRRRSQRLKKIFKDIRASITHYVLGIFPSLMNSLLDDYRIYKSYFAENEGMEFPIHKLEDPKKYVFIPTSSGIVAFNEKTTIDEFIKRKISGGKAIKYSVEKLGGVLNSVYMLKVAENGAERKLVVKVFKDWYGWKWFPLTLWALGTRGFTVLGKARLEREYALNMFLSNHGINVPKIIYISPREKLLFQEHIEGVSISEIIRRLYRIKNNECERSKLLKVVRYVGREIAKIHNLCVSLGDCKPENIILAPSEKIFFVDLEQAEIGGNQAWDISEFLHYSGHYTLLPPLNVVSDIVREFIYGYLEANGKIGNIKKALSPRYVKVFSFFTPPHVIFTISNTCKSLLEDYTSREAN